MTTAEVRPREYPSVAAEIARRVIERAPVMACRCGRALWMADMCRAPKLIASPDGRTQIMPIVCSVCAQGLERIAAGARR